MSQVVLKTGEHGGRNRGPELRDQGRDVVARRLEVGTNGRQRNALRVRASTCAAEKVTFGNCEGNSKAKTSSTVNIAESIVLFPVLSRDRLAAESVRLT